MMNIKPGLSPSSISNNNSFICLNDTPQARTNSCISPYADSNTTYYSHDSGAMRRQELDQSWILAQDSNSLLSSDQTHEHEYSIHPSQQCQTDSLNNSVSFSANETNHDRLLENESPQIYNPCNCCHSQNYSGQSHNIVVSPQSCSWDEMVQDTHINALPGTTYSQDEVPCSFKVIVMPPQKYDKSTYICKECGQHFTKESNLKKHIERLSQQLEEPYFKCKYCSHVFKTKEARKRHHPVHKACPTNSFTRVRCSVCGFKFSSKEKLQHHLHRFTENSDERIFKCFFCSHAFTTDFSRNRHEGQMHTEAHKLPCCCCGKLFTNRYKLKLHRIKQQIQRPPRCQDCGWVFAAQEYLEDHIRQVQRDLPLECLICYHRYQSRLALLRHLKFHTRKMEYECPSCLGRFSSQNLLTKHLRTAPRRANVEPY